MRPSCIAIVILIALAIPATPLAQGGRGGAPGPQVVSPQVNADRSVTLRVLAPKATEITVTGEILNGAQPAPMTKGEDGVWTVTTAPLPPDVYMYAFRIDGVNTPDPRNPWVKLVSGTGLASQVEVPGDRPQYYDVKAVPHGLVQILTYESKSASATRQAWVYTPPDYTRTTTTYPVLYLLHGGGDLDPGWTLTGRAPIIMDNLIAEKKATPMIVVMPLARGGGSLGIGPAGMSPGIAAAGNLGPAPARGVAPGTFAGRAGLDGITPGTTGPAPLQAFAQDFIGDLLPAVEQTFRVSSRAEDRAIGGLSMGGSATMNTAFSRPDLFRYVIVLSAGGGQNLEAAYPKFFGNGAAAAKQMRLIWVAAGDGDFALDGAKALDGALTSHGINHTFKITPGRHEWRLWRPHLYEFAQLLFMDKKPGAAIGLSMAQGVPSATTPQRATEGEWRPLFDGKTLDGWKETLFVARGKVNVEQGTVVLGNGYMTGITWTRDFPTANYEIRYEAARMQGTDFFGAVTFPVHKSFCTFVNGGWGGMTVGLSSLDLMDASENETRAFMTFNQNQWYAFRVRVTDDTIEAWIDEEPVVSVNFYGREVGLRPGEIENSRPLGFASYRTVGALRKIEYRLLPPARDPGE